MGDNPFIPKGLADIAFIDGRIDRETINKIRSYNIRVMPTICCEDLYDAISYHPDIVMHPINHNTLIIAPNVYDYYKEELSDTPLRILKGEKKLDRNYPNNIAYNVARVSRFAFHNLKYTDEKLKFYLQKEKVEFVNVNQGYSKCSVANIGSNSLITSDKSIYKEANKKNLDALLIHEGFITLPGLNYGFIGGTNGYISSKYIVFTGTYNEHPNANEINKFMKKHKISPKILSRNKIIDVGSIITFKYN